MSESILVYKDSHKPVRVGDKCKTFRGEAVEVTAIHAPYVEGGTGRVSLRWLETGAAMQVFPSVINAAWSDNENLEAKLTARVAELRAENERLVMQLAACGVAALANTPESAVQQRDIAEEYQSASWDDVCCAVDREMALRARVQELEAARSLLPDMPISDAMRREWERYILRPFDSAADGAFRAMLRVALTEKGGE